MMRRTSLCTWLIMLPLAFTCLAPRAARAEILVNGGFETGDFTGWTTGANSYPQTIVTSPVASGIYPAQITGYSSFPNTLSQSLATVQGSVYRLSFARAVAGGTETTAFSANWDGTTLYSETNPGDRPYQHYSFDVVGGGNDVLQFISANDPGETFLDDVSLTLLNPNLIANGGFETGDFTGWTTGANSFPQTIVTSPVAGGSYAAQITGYSAFPNTLSQSIETTVGQEYFLSFDRAVAIGTAVTQLTVAWNGTTVYAETDPGEQSYQRFRFRVVGTGNDSLLFTSSNDPGYTFLDNVSLLKAVPEPGSATLFAVGLLVVAGGAARRCRRD